MANSDPDRLDAWRRLAALHVRVASELDSALRLERDLTLSLFEVLDALATHGGRLGAGELAARLGANASSLTRRLDRLEEEEWITRTRASGDARHVTIGLTKDGRETYRAGLTTWRRTLQQEFTAYLTDTDVAALARIAGKINA